MRHKRHKKILEPVAYAMACTTMLVGITVMAAVREDVRTEFAEDVTLATSQEIKTKPAIPTGKISTNEVGIVAVINKMDEPVAVKCLWAPVELTQNELELLYTTVYCESGDQELEAQIMVAQTIINRVISPKYPDTLRGVIYQRNSVGAPQFSVINWSNFEERGWTDTTKSAVHYALSYKAYPESMLYFRSGGHFHSFGQPYKQVDDMYFSLEVK